MSLFMICMAVFVNELVPATKWYHLFTYILLWPSILGEWVKEKF